MQDEKNMMQIPSPKQIYDHLNEYVIGQDDAKKVLSVAIYNHYKRLLINVSEQEEILTDDIEIEKSNILLLGNTGSGKTFLIKSIAKYLGVPCYIADTTTLTQSGYVGDDVENVLVGLLRECDFNVQAAEYGICILDELDKVGSKSENPSITRDVGGEGVQQSLLKMVEGGKVSVPPQGGRKHPHQECIEIDTTNILFIGLGAFSGLDKIVQRRCNTLNSVGFTSGESNDKIKIDDNNYLKYVETDDLRKFGMIPELLGRFPIITHTNPLTKEDLIRILTEPKNAIVKQYQKLLSFDNVKLTFTKKAYEIIAETAFENKTGARGLRKIMEKILNDVMFEYGGNTDEKEIKIDDKFVSKALNVKPKKKEKVA